MGRANINTLAGETGIEGEGERQSKGCVGMVEERKGRMIQKDANKSMEGHKVKGREATNVCIYTYMVRKCKVKSNRRRKVSLVKAVCRDKRRKSDSEEADREVCIGRISDVFFVV